MAAQQHTTTTLKLRDGRTLAYASYGDPEGKPVIYSHGLSDSRFIRHFDDDLTKSLGVRIVAVDQPGVGGSSPTRNRTLKQYALDVEELANALDLQQFAVAGHSGGGPHAMAIAAHLGPQRVTRGILAAPAPPLDGSVPGIVEAFGPWYVGFLLKILQWCPFVLNGLCRLLAWWVNRGTNVQSYLEMVATSDRTNGNPETFLEDPRQTKVFHDNFTAGFAQGAVGIQGMLQVVMLQPQWGFTLQDDLPQPFDFFMSDLDPAITVEMGQLMVNVMPRAKLHTFTNAGHYSFVDRSCWIQFWSVLKEEDDAKKE